MIDVPRRMRLTPELVARCRREVAAPGPGSRYDYFDEADYDRAVAAVMAGKPEGSLWIFAYGSLIWKPEFPTREGRRATARGWQRGFSMRIESHRGTPEQPGYMMCLDRGGSCEGVALRLDDADHVGQIRELLYREIGSEEALDGARWIDLETDAAPIRALTFYAYPHRLDNYAENRPLDEVAHALARACGHWGSGAEYLYNTVHHLESMGIHDPRLWLLQELVAREIEDMALPA